MSDYNRAQAKYWLIKALGRAHAERLIAEHIPELVTSGGGAPEKGFDRHFLRDTEFAVRVIMRSKNMDRTPALLWYAKHAAIP